MAKTPTPKSYDEILGEILQTFMSKIGVNDLNTGSASISFFEAVAQAIYRSSGGIFDVLRDFSVDRATGEALKRIAKEENVRITPATPATGFVTITDSSFDKISTKVYAGAPPPNEGSTVLKVSDASQFPATGQIYIGRGTNNIEGPISYTAITPVGGYYEITLATPTTKYHNINESVILAQGGLRTIAAGTVVTTDPSGATPGISFTISKAVSILDGENEITNVPVVAQEPGTKGNVPRNSIKIFTTPPFAGAIVTNPAPFTTGKDEQSDEELRDAIKRARISRGLGTALAVKNATFGAKAPDENATVVSNEIFSDGDRTVLFIDNGEGYEEKLEGVGLEPIVDSALGGEQFFQLATGGQQTSIAKAFLITTQEAPFNVNPGDKLSILVGGVLSEHVFNDGDFRSNGFATAFEIVSSINANADLKFIARTIENRNKVIITAKDETNEYLQKIKPSTGVDAGDALGLQESEAETIKLYKNGVPLSKNGRPALIESEDQNLWSSTMTTGETLIIAIDGTDPVTYTFTDADFAKEGTYQTLSATNSLDSWKNVINNKITGITASVNGLRIVLRSNLGESSRASIVIDPTSTLVSKGMFSTNKGLESYGVESDFTLSRNTAQLKLTKPLEKGDSLTAGSEFTQASVESGPIFGGNVVFANDASIWITVDGPDVEIIKHGVITDSQLDVIKQPNNIIRFRSVLDNAFLNVQEGDYVIIWSEELNIFNRFEAKVSSVGTDLKPYDYFEIRVTANEYTNAFDETVTFKTGLTFTRGPEIPQKVTVPAGTYNINNLADYISDKLIGANVTVKDDERLVVTTKNKATTGAILVVDFDENGKNMNFVQGTKSVSTFSHFAFYQTNEDSQKFPLFIHGSITQDSVANPPTTFIPTIESSIDLSTYQVEPIHFVNIQDPYLVNGLFIKDAQSTDYSTQIDAITGTTIKVSSSSFMRRNRVSDRYYLTRALDLSHEDSMTVILDNDSIGKTFPINLFRNIKTEQTTTVNPNQFRALDVDGGNVSMDTFFSPGGNDFNFKNFRAFMRARAIIDPSSNAAEDAILYRSAEWGKSGEKFRIGYFYPTYSNQDIGYNISITDTVDINISLKSGNPFTTTIDGTTEWDVTITPNSPSPGIDTVTYTYNGNGAHPGLASVTPGSYVTISQETGFDPANLGTFRVVSVSAGGDAFTIRRENAGAVAETGALTDVPSGIRFYEASPTTAQEIVTFVNTNMKDWIEAELLDDGGLTGAGIISLSTYEDNNFAANSQYFNFTDGYNLIKSSSISQVAPNFQFEFKWPIVLTSFSTNTPNAYRFDNGEEIRLVPTTISQVVDFMQILAVTGITTVSKVEGVLRDGSAQITTETLGAKGSVYLTGGSANSVNAQVVAAASKVPDTGYILVTLDRAAATGIIADSVIKLEAQNAQKKNTGISFTTQVTITPNQPLPSQSIIELGNREIYDRYFGEPKKYFRDEGRAFHVEKHGSLAFIGWDKQTGLDPNFEKIIELNDSAGGTVTVTFDSNTLTATYTIDSGNINFQEVNVDDIAIISNLPLPENNGTFEVLGVSADGKSLSVKNPNASNMVSTAIGAGDIKVFGKIVEGDTVEIFEPFHALNRGQFRVIRVFDKGFYIDNPSAVEERVVIPGQYRTTNIDTTSQFNVSISTTTGYMRIEYTGTGTAPDFSSVRMGDIAVLTDLAFAASNQGEFMVMASGATWIEVANARAVAQPNFTLISATGFQIHVPSIRFDMYENTVKGDYLQITGNVLSDANIGKYTIVDVLAKDKAVVDSILAPQTNVQLNNDKDQVYIEEGKPYIGFKEVLLKAVSPSDIEKVNLVLKSNYNYNKITEEGIVKVSAISKLNFPTKVSVGFDSYKYYTGLIREVNKIVYGDPRDSATYPGVSAAGAEIFIEPPLIRRIRISINVRVNTGIPFARIIDQVRNNISAFINSLPIGQSIAISDIIATVNSIPGTRAISITFPDYSPTNDMIVVNPSEKPLILDLINDITVSKVE